MRQKVSSSTSDNSRNMQALIVLALVGFAAASGSYNYYGRYAGKCGNDGIYYNDASSFVLCSNGNAYHQPCAPGSRNGAYNNYNYGKSYGYADFCGVNLVDYGYGAHHQGYGHQDTYRQHDAPRYGNQGYGDRHGYTVEKTEYKSYNNKGYGHQDNGYGHQDNGYGHQDNGYGHQDNGYGHQDNGYGHQDNGYGHQDNGYGYPGNRGYERVEVKKVSYGGDKHH